jgi:mannose-6-phosphate isomerase-like protein (cupin superfamily)
MTDSAPAAAIAGAEVVLPCADLDATLNFFTRRLGFKVDAIHPADAPAVARLSGHGLALRLEKGAAAPPGRLRLLCRVPGKFAGGAAALTAPNGTVIDIVDADPPVHVPAMKASLVVSHLRGESGWGVGRAGMLYRDLVPDRQGGRFIVSHIRIPEGGPVPDYVHFHKIRFQAIFVRRGWVRLVYEDQGEPFVMHAGDCVLQPPRIRHRVLEASPGLEVIEIGCPAEHETLADRTMTLPTGRLDPARDFGGQRYVLHTGHGAPWAPWRLAGFEARDTGIGDATFGLGGIRVVRPAGATASPRVRHEAEFVFWFVLAGAVTFAAAGGAPERLGADSSVAVPAGLAHALADATPDLEFLEITLPARFASVPA